MRSVSLRIAILTLIITPPLAAQVPVTGDSLTVARIFSAEFGARGIGQLRWVEGGAAFITVDPAASGGGREIVRHETATDAKSVLVTAAQLTPAGANAALGFQSFAWSEDNSKLLLFTNTKKVWRQNTRGDYWVLNRPSGKLTKLGGDASPSTLMFATFSPDGRMVAYVRDNDMYAESLVDGKITRLTSNGSRTSINGTSDWVYEEELDIRKAFDWSPDSKRIAFWHFDASTVRDFLLINDTDSLYPAVTPIPYPKAGTTNSRVTVGVVAPTGGEVRWMDVVGDTAKSYIARMQWLDASSILVQHLNRRQNQNNFWIGDASTGKGRVAFTDRDSAWVDVQDLTWVDGGKTALIESERDGWRHLYTVRADGTRLRKITDGPYDVIDLAGIDEKAGIVYFLASPTDATQRYLYRVALKGGKAMRVTPANQAGRHAYDISPNGQWAVHTVSRFDVPPRVEMIRLPSHAVVRVIQDNHEVAAKFATLKAPPTEFFHVKTREGVPLDGWLMRPVNFDSTKSYPVLVHVYGEPASQTVTDSWGGAGMLFHRMIANEGYLVVSIDNRGTPGPKGREWRKSVYGAIGVAAAADQAAGLRALAAMHRFVDTTRVAIWGWSGGGTNTLNAVFRNPELFKVGMSVAPVPDQKLYDTIYQERYMGLPQENVEGYKRGSAINFADGLRGRLLVVHGSGDDNVHYQGTERLVNRLVALGKRFDLMVYPNRTHGIFEGPGTTAHLYSLLHRYLTENLPAGGRGVQPTS
ncbi:MAG: S9 family peptidase [Gemmatimonadales bacterium]|nr:S9 family peptidase [Gemmatimonadales bacterium]